MTKTHNQTVTARLTNVKPPLEPSTQEKESVAQGDPTGGGLPVNRADAKTPSQLLSQWLTPAGLSATLLFLAVIFYFTALAHRERYFLDFGVDFTLLPLEKQDYIFLGGKVTALALANFASKIVNAPVIAGLCAAGVFVALLIIFGDWAQKKSPQLRDKAPRWMRSATFNYAAVILASAAGFPLFALFLPVLAVAGLIAPGLLGSASGRQEAADVRTAAKPNCTQSVKDATCVEILDDGKATIKGVLLGGNKDRVAILNSNGVLVITLGTKTVRPLPERR